MLKSLENFVQKNQFKKFLKIFKPNFIIYRLISQRCWLGVLDGGFTSSIYIWNIWYIGLIGGLVYEIHIMSLIRLQLNIK